MDHRLCVFVLLTGTLSLGANYRTANFQVEAPTPAAAQEVGQAAEKFRKDLGLAWLGQEITAWPQPCSIQVKIVSGGAAGFTTFNFDRGRVTQQHMQVEGTLERILRGILPHEMTHIIFAHYFGQPSPRWADEGGAVFSEAPVEWERHDRLLAQVQSVPGRSLPLQRLFACRDYPPDAMAFYAQASSIARFLLTIDSRPTFLAFVAQGMRDGWDAAVKAHYRYRSVEQLEAAWVRHQHESRYEYQGGRIAGAWTGAVVTELVKQSRQGLRGRTGSVRPEQFISDMVLLLTAKTSATEEKDAGPFGMLSRLGKLE